MTSDDRRNRGQNRSNLSSSVNGVADIRVGSVYSLKFGCLMMSKPSIYSITVILNQYSQARGVQPFPATVLAVKFYRWVRFRRLGVRG